MLARDGIMDRIKSMSFFSGFTFKRSHAFSIQPNLMPYACVYLLGEDLTPDGDADAGEPRFRSIARIGFSIIILNNDPDAAEDRMDDAYQAIFTGLLTDPTLYNNSRFKIQGFARGNRSHYYGTASNETPYAELRAELHCDLGTIDFEPRIEDMLETIHVETVHPPGDTQNQHVFSVYDLDQGE